MFDFSDSETPLDVSAREAPETEEDDEEEAFIICDAWRVPRGRCACGRCKLWQKASGPFAHLTCSFCNCRTADHEDLSGWMREVLEQASPSAESYFVNKGIPLQAYLKWSPLEALFHVETGMAFDPVRDGRGEPAAPEQDTEHPLCSVICPTTAERHAFHPLLYHCFSHQTYHPKELVVVDTGPKPSTFLQERARRDPSLVYRWFKDARWSIGLKRNLACFLARGEVLAHFDDDDLYAPGYLWRMAYDVFRAAANPPPAQEEWPGAEQAPAEGLPAVAATLVTWHVLDTKERTFRLLHAVSDKWVYGWGFSFVYTRKAWRHNFFPCRDVGEDFDFMTALRRRRGAQVLTVDEPEAVCSHTYHPKLSISGGEKRRNGAQGPIGQEVPPPEALVALLPRLFEADARAMRDMGRRPPPSEEDFTYSLLGSWSGWTSFDELRRAGHGRSWTATIPIAGAPTAVDFQVFANSDLSLCFHPSRGGAVLGPWRCPGANWHFQVPAGRTALMVTWDPSGERSLHCTATDAAPRPEAPRPRPAPRPRASVPTLTLDQALEMQYALIAEYTKEDFQERLQKVWSTSDPVLRIKLRQDLCLPIQGPIIKRFGFEPSRKGVQQTVNLFMTAEFRENPRVMLNNSIMKQLTDPSIQDWTST